MSAKRLAGSLLAAALLAGCAGMTKPAAPAASVDAAVVSAHTRFGVSLFQALRAEKPGENLFISPASVSLALSMTANGARGETQQAMTKALALEGQSLEAINRENAALQSILANPDPKVELAVANSIWYKQGFKVGKAFEQTVKEQYHAEIRPADFGNPSAARSMNDWIAKATRNKIKDVIGETSAEARMFLINAIYFNGKWTDPFDPNRTRPLPFHFAGGNAKELPMMNRSGHFRYLKGENFQAAALPYGDGRLSMYVFLPNQGVTLDAFYKGLTAERWEEWMSQFARKEGSLTLPKVKLAYKADLIPSMKKLGMGIAFSGQADFGNLLEDSKEQLAISLLLHQTYLDMDEKGTEAAAVTVVGVEGSAAPRDPDRFTMIVDRPYMIAIRDDKTGALLFLGSIMNPQK